MQILADRIKMLRLIPKGGVCCEVGVLRGEYSQRIVNIVQPSKHYLIDTWQDHLDLKGTESHEFVLNRFSKEITDGKVIVLHGTSAAKLIAIPENSLDFIYLDGCHEYENVLAELFVAYEKLKIGGILAGHDYCMLRDFAVVRAVAVFCHIKKLTIDYLTAEKEIPIDPKYKPKKNWPEKLAYNSFGIVKKG